MAKDVNEMDDALLAVDEALTSETKEADDNAWYDGLINGGTHGAGKALEEQQESKDEPEKVKEPSVKDGNSHDVNMADEARAKANAKIASYEENKASFDALPKSQKESQCESLLKAETTLGTKTVQDGESTYKSGGKRLDTKNMGEFQELLGGTVTKCDPKVDGKDTKGLYHYDGDLGTFNYDPDDFAIGTKELIAEDGTHTTMPILKCVEVSNAGMSGRVVDGDKLIIPDGVKSLDYTFEDMKYLKTIPYIPDSVTSAHCAFKDCIGVTRACDAAKSGEHDGSATKYGFAAGLAAAGVGAGIGLKTGLAAGTAVTPGLGTLGGALIGTAVGAIGGAITGASIEDTKSNGKGGTWAMPKGLQDASYMFTGCEKLTESFQEANDDVVNVRGMHYGNAALGTDVAAIKYGSAVITDFKDSKVSDANRHHSLTGTSVEILDGTVKDNFSKDWNTETNQLEGNYSEDEKNQVESVDAASQAADIKDGYVDTDMSVLTGGAAQYASRYTQDGTILATNDINAENAVTDEMLANTTSATNWVDRGIVSVGQFALAKLVTGNTMWALGITAGGQALGILPTSMKPILDGVVGFVGKDNPVGAVLSSISDKLPDYTKADLDDKVVINDQDRTEKDLTDATYATADARIGSTIANGVKSAAVDGSDVSSYMRNNGQSVARDGVFLTLMNKDANDPEFKTMQDVVGVSMAGLEAKADGMNADGMSKSDKDALAKQCISVASGLSAYQAGAKEGLSEYYTGAELMQGEAGLSRAMDATGSAAFDSIKKMNAEYNFLSKDNIKELDLLNIGSLGTFSSYQPGANKFTSAPTLSNTTKSVSPSQTTSSVETRLSKSEPPQGTSQTREQRSAQLDQKFESALSVNEPSGFGEEFD